LEEHAHRVALEMLQQIMRNGLRLKPGTTVKRKAVCGQLAVTVTVTAGDGLTEFGLPPTPTQHGRRRYARWRARLVEILWLMALSPWLIGVPQVVGFAAWVLIAAELILATAIGVRK